MGPILIEAHYHCPHSLVPIIHAHMPCKNITRYTYETTAFQGYRLAICKNKRLFTRYFSDSQYGGAEAALQEAMRVRDNILKLL